MSARLDRSALRALLERPGVARVLAALAAPGEETRLVGGAVRDALLGLPVSDMDLATTLTPEAVVAAAAGAGLRSIPTGIEHGTITLLADSETFEVTTLREDVETDGRHAVVRFGRDFTRDAERRDFTVNALSLAGDGTLHDPVGGLPDLEAGRVRFIGDPATRIREDALRILRFFRFHARYGSGAPDAAGLAACVEAREAPARLSRERIRAEILKLLAAPGAVAAVVVLSDTGLLQRLLGGIGDGGRLGRAVAAGLPPILRLAALCVWSVEDADRLRERLRLSKAEHAQLHAHARALAALLDPVEIDALHMRALTAEHGADGIAAAFAVLDGGARPALTGEARRNLEESKDAPPPALPLGGDDLVARGVTPGPAIGRGLAAARALWLSLGCPVDDAARERLIAEALEAASR